MNAARAIADYPTGLHSFLDEAGWSDAMILPLSGDASFRRYFRLHAPDGRTAVLMDAPPGREDVRPFYAVGQWLVDQGLSAPRIFHADANAGLLLLEDLGDDLLDPAIAKGGHEAVIYRAATDVLIHLHRSAPPSSLPGLAAPHRLPRFDETQALAEVRRFLDWYWPEVTGAAPSAGLIDGFEAAWRQVGAVAMFKADALVQFDYHSVNLLWLPERSGLRRVGLLDFQDSMIGAPVYDLVSLLQDARRDVAAGIETEMLAHYTQATGLASQTLSAAYAYWGAQRATRLLGQFVRLWRRDGKPGYLKHIPRQWRYLDCNLAHPVLAPLADWFARHSPSALRQTAFPTEQTA